MQLLIDTISNPIPHFFGPPFNGLSYRRSTFSARVLKLEIQLVYANNIYLMLKVSRFLIFERSPFFSPGVGLISLGPAVFFAEHLPVEIEIY